MDIFHESTRSNDKIPLLLSQTITHSYPPTAKTLLLQNAYAFQCIAEAFKAANYFKTCTTSHNVAETTIQNPRHIVAHSKLFDGQGGSLALACKL